MKIGSWLKHCAIQKSIYVKMKQLLTEETWDKTAIKFLFPLKWICFLVGPHAPHIAEALHFWVLGFQGTQLHPAPRPAFLSWHTRYQCHLSFLAGFNQALKLRKGCYQNKNAHTVIKPAAKLPRIQRKHEQNNFIKYPRILLAKRNFHSMGWLKSKHFQVVSKIVAFVAKVLVA